MRARILFLSVAVAAVAAAAPNFVDKVDMSMGVAGDSNGVIGPQLPHGSINPSPQTPHGGHGGYRLGQPIRGFGQLHVSGTGWGTYGQIFFSPQIGVAIGETEHDSPATDEIATPAYYAATLQRYGIRAEVTPAHHAAIYRFTYPARSDAALVFDLAHSIPTDIAPEIKGKFQGGEVHVDAARRALWGYGVYAGGFTNGAPYTVWFYAEVNADIRSFGTWEGAEQRPDRADAAGTQRLGAYLRFRLDANGTEAPSNIAEGGQGAPASGAPVLLKVAVSFRNGETARSYLEREIPRFDFGAVRQTAEAEWNQALGTIVLEGASAEQEHLFYTTLYHSFLMPRDRTGDNVAWSSELPFWDDQYAVWDTWRTKFPLMCLIRPSVVRDNVMSFVDRLRHRGEVGDSFVAGHDGPKQGGDDIDNIIAEAYATRVPGIDWDKARDVLRHDAAIQRYPEYRERGWIPDDRHPLMACSNTLECAYNDACAATVFADAKSMDQDAAAYLARARAWEQLWNPALTSDGVTGFIQPRRSDGTWVAIDAKQNFGSWHSHFYEANSWTYSLFVPHDFARVIQLCGGPEKFVARVDHAFAAGLVELANEPSFMAARSLNYAGRPDRNAYWTHHVMTHLYGLKRGYPGNEDSGAMGSWYVFSALGFFPNAGQGVYLVNGPFCRHIEVTLGNGRKLAIDAKDVSDTNIYVQTMTLNGKPWPKNWFTYDDIAAGGHLEFVMGPQPSTWGTKPPFAPSLSER